MIHPRAEKQLDQPTGMPSRR